MEGGQRSVAVPVLALAMALLVVSAVRRLFHMSAREYRYQFRSCRLVRVLRVRC